MVLGVEEGPHLLARDLLLEEGTQHEGGGSLVFEPLHQIEVVGERARAHDQRVGKAHPQIRRRGAHFASFAGTGAVASSPGGASMGTVIPASC